MIIRLLLSLVLGLACLGVLAAPGYPFSVASEKDGDSRRIVARNDGPAPISVKVAIAESQTLATDRPFPVLAVVPPGGTLELGRVGPAVPGSGYSFRLESTWTRGDFNAEQAPDALYRLPYRDGSAFRIGQAPGGPITTHEGPDARYAVDIPMPEGTPVVAARDGVVIHTEADQVDGGQTPEMLGKANEVTILHADGTMAVYAHLAPGGVRVSAGQLVAAGQEIGLAGSTGYSSGPHLHFVVQTLRRSGEGFEAVSLPFRFYVGNPPAAFAPQFGMLAKAEYDVPAGVPGFSEPPRIALANPAAGGILPTGLRGALLAVPAWQWFCVMAALTLLWLWRAQARWARRGRERGLQAPVRRSRPAEELPVHGLTDWDRLVIACRSDRRLAEGLMEHEMRSSPGIGRQEAAQLALQRLRGDRA